MEFTTWLRLGNSSPTQKTAKSLIACCGSPLSGWWIVILNGKLSGFLSSVSLLSRDNGRPLIPTRLILRALSLYYELRLETFLVSNQGLLPNLLSLPLIIISCQHFMAAFVASCRLLIFVFHYKAYPVPTASFVSNNRRSSLY